MPTSFTTDKDGDVTHDLTTVYGKLVLVIGDAPVFATSHLQHLFEELERVDQDEAFKAKVLLVSSEDRSSDDVTALIWEAMVSEHGGCLEAGTLEEYRDLIGEPCPFVEHGYEEHLPDLPGEYRRRQGIAETRTQRLAALRAEVETFQIAAE